MSDPTHQFTTRPNRLASDLIAGTFHEMFDTPAIIEGVVPANMHAFHHTLTPHEALAELRSLVLVLEETIARSCRLMHARTPEKLPRTPQELPFKVGRAAQPAKVDVSRPRITTDGSEDELQRHLMDMAGLTNTKPRHINWCGKAVWDRTAKYPAVSLCVIVAPPKKEYFDIEINLCTTVLLHNAFHLVYPILFTGDFSVLNSCSGTKLQNAVIGSCYKFYNKRGCWFCDEREADEEIPVLDTIEVHDYSTDDTILNGWFSTRNLPVGSVLLSYSAQFAKQYHAARKPAMEEIACKKGEVMQERVLRQTFIYFGASVTAADAPSRRPERSEAQRPPDGAVTATTFKTPAEATRTGSVSATERANTLPSNENPKSAELPAAPEEIFCDKLHGSATEASGFERKREGWVPEPDKVSQACFDNGSQHSTGTDDTSVSTSSTSVDGMQQVSENLTAATLTLYCALTTELNLPGLVEPRSPLSTFKRTRMPARRASWASFPQQDEGFIGRSANAGAREQSEDHEGLLQAKAERPALNIDIGTAKKGGLCARRGLRGDKGAVVASGCGTVQLPA